MGRASNRQKAHRQAASSAQQVVPTIQSRAKRQLALVDELNAVNKALRRQAERYLTVCRTWSGGSEPEPARAPRCPPGLLGRQVLASKFAAQFEELAVLSRGLDGAIPGVPGSVVADALADAVSGRYPRVLPPELLQHIDPAPIIDPLEILVVAGVVTPGDVLNAGLAILSSIVIPCENDALSTGKQVA